MNKRTREEENQLLQTLNQAISEAPDFHTALFVTLLQVCELTGWGYGEAWIPCKNSRVLELSPVWYSTPQRAFIGNTTALAIEQFRLCSESFVLPPAIGLPGRVWSSQQPEWIVDVSAHSETYFLRNQIAKACGIKAGFGVPVIVNHQVLAVLIFFMTQACKEDKRLIELVAAVTIKLGAIMQRSSIVQVS